MRDLPGPLELRFQGAASAAEPTDLSPTNHRPASTATCSRCRDCGTVQQPSLPAGADLHELYRGMERRRLPRRGGRSPDHRAPPARPDRRARSGAAGCSTSAAATGCCSTRRAGAATRSRGSSCPPARPPTGARSSVSTVREQALADFSRRPSGFDVDRAGRRARAPRRSRCGRRAVRRSCWRRAACCASSRPTRRRARARLAGKRWWGYLPAHTYLLPRAHAARGDERPRPRDLGGRAAGAVLRAALLGRRAWPSAAATAPRGSEAGCAAAAWAARACRCRSATSAWCSLTASSRSRRPSRA